MEIILLVIMIMIMVIGMVSAFFGFFKTVDKIHADKKRRLMA